MPRAAMVISEMALALPPLVGPSSAEAELARSVAEGKAPATEVTLAAAEAAPAAMAAALRDLDAEGTFLSHMVGALAGHTLVDEAGAPRVRDASYVTGSTNEASERRGIVTNQVHIQCDALSNVGSLHLDCDSLAIKGGLVDLTQGRSGDWLGCDSAQ